MTALTSKGEQTRQLILDTALEMFVRRGYEATTMRDISAEANVSLGLAYRYFENKESLLLALYERMAEHTVAAVSGLAQGQIADRFIATMNACLKHASPNRQALQALYGAMLTPAASGSLLWTGTGNIRKKAELAFIRLVQNASDSLKSAQAQNLGKFLYFIHFAILFFWLHDSSQNQKTTRELLSFTRRGLGLLRRSFRLPFISTQVGRFVHILEKGFGG